MKLSEHFSLNELLRSSYADDNNVEEQYNPTADIIKNLSDLVNTILEPVRLTIGMPIFVTSGYRCKRVNKNAGGASSSDHLNGMAADIHCSDNLILWNELKKTPYKQLIWYYEDSKIPEFIHVSYDKNDIRRETKVCYLSTNEQGIEKRKYKITKR